ncbi:MAG: leucine--tRNA ligase [Chloroflexi bacterium]|nr:leucine--tRNA ligase [Chloroflexota bacterium]MCL5075997.1 leucine--tRNA ligase [Chloroflexota bacterium]
MRAKYEPAKVEGKWQARWEADKLYEVTETNDRAKWYALNMFPYTSGDIHIGHWYHFAPADTHARHKRMQGYNVMEPIGFDAFGLPAENAAIRSGIHPYIWTTRNIENMRRQLKNMGAMYDWSREVATCLPDYYKWTQWFFLQLYKHGLAYRAKAPANWCPSCATVLANEQVIDGRCERCDSIVTRRDLEQWFFRITAYAEELLDHSKIDWPERVCTMQKNWIGKSVGVEIMFQAESGQEMPVFTTRPDTVYGVTFMVLAPEHPLVSKLTAPDRRAAVEEYVELARRESEIERLATERERTGVFIGAYALNPVNGERVPIWIADYVLLTYGTGIVMGVPGHDQRDFEFAKQFDLPIRVVIAPPGWQGEELAQAFIDEGTMVNSGPFDGLPSAEGKERIAEYLEREGSGQRRVNYRLRDWLVSRQRYWGAPIPIIYCPQCGIVPVPEEQLPVLLPADAEFRPTGESPLKLSRSFVETVCPACGGPAERETDTMDTFVCSSWYFLRYCSPKYQQGPFDPEKVRYWMPVDQYIGGVEHATMHLLYARFFTKALRDIGLVDFDEPFTRLFNQGLIICQSRKMSKSRGNVIAPDNFVAELGSDTVRAYLMFIGPWDQGGEWSDEGINGIYRFLNRVWNLVQNELHQSERRSADPVFYCAEAERELQRMTHKKIKRVSEDIEKFRYNTMLSTLMEFTNYLVKAQNTDVVRSPSWPKAIETLLLLLAPTAPHLTEELWARLGLPYSIHQQSWPKWDEDFVTEEMIVLVIQVNGKVRDKVSALVSLTEAEAKELALRSKKVQNFINGRRVTNVVYVPGRLVNLVVA